MIDRRASQIWLMSGWGISIIAKYMNEKITSLITRHAKSYNYNTYNSNTNVHIKFSAHDALKGKPSSGTLKDWKVK